MFVLAISGRAVSAPTALMGSIEVVPAAACPSDSVTVVFTVENVGGEPITGVSVSPALLVEGTGSAMPMGGPVPSMVSVLDPGGKAAFTWNYYAEAPGSLKFTGTANGSGPGGPESTGAVSSAPASVVDPANASVSVAAGAPSAAVVGEWVQVVMHVTDAGGTGVKGVVPAIAAGPLVAQVFGPSPTGPVDIAPGMTEAFTWTYSVSGAGTVLFSVSMAGQVCMMPVQGSGAAPMTVTGGPAGSTAKLTAAIAAAPGQVTVGEQTVVTMTVMNTGDKDVTDVAPGALQASGTGSALLGPPVPATVSVLQPGSSATFTWVATAAAAGTIAWTGRAAGTPADAVGGNDVMSNRATSGSVLVYAAPRIPTRILSSASSVRGRVSGLVDLTFRVLDGQSLPVPGALVTLEVVAGGGVAYPLSGATDANGVILVRLKLGPQQGSNVVRVAVAGGTNPTATVSVEGEMPGVPTPYLSKNFFDPARGETVQIRVLVPEPMRAAANIYDMSGELVRRVNDRDVPAGLTVWQWDGRNGDGEVVGNGMYFVQIASGGSVRVKRIIVLKRG